MRPVAISSILVLSSAFAAGAAGSDNDELLRINPWIKAVRDEAFYRQCQSSCTDYSQGTMTKVELCDDTEVSSLNGCTRPNLFTNLEPQNQLIEEFYVAQKPQTSTSGDQLILSSSRMSCDGF